MFKFNGMFVAGVLWGAGATFTGLIVYAQFVLRPVPVMIECRCKPEIRDQEIQASFCSRETGAWEHECLYRGK